MMRLLLPFALLFAGCAGGDPVVCVNDSYQCVGDQVERCEDDLWVVEETCAANEACVVEAGVGGCEEDVGAVDSN